uniref:Uncharacterized protein n=1 Tax=Plectus sambesii TaxID=2011161 RepID=A0A914VZ14_9BILA
MIYVIIVFWQGLWQVWPLVLLVAASVGAYLASSTPALPASSPVLAEKDDCVALLTREAHELKSNDTSVEPKLSADLYGRNLLNKKEGAPPSTIKESSESSQTLDEQDADKGAGTGGGGGGVGGLKHENTVVRVDTTASKTMAGTAQLAQQQTVVSAPCELSLNAQSSRARLLLPKSLRSFDYPQLSVIHLHTHCLLIDSATPFFTYLQ